MNADAVGTKGFSLFCLGAALACREAGLTPVIAGNTGSIRVLATDMDTPTTVAVRNGIAWVPEGQFTHFPTLGGDGAPGPFAVRSVSLNGDGIRPTSINLPAPDYYPEGIAANLATGDLYIGSILNGTILRVRNATTATEDFLPAVPEVLQRGALGLRVDNGRRILWVCDSNLGATPARPGGTLVGIYYSDGSLAVRHELPPGSICNDILVDSGGALFVTESALGVVYSVPAELALVDDSAEPWLEHPALAPLMPTQFGANGIALAGSRLFIANTSAGTLVRVDPSAADPASTVSVVELSEAGVLGSVTLSGPDGVYELSDTQLLVVENGFGGTGLRRLIEIQLDPE